MKRLLVAIITAAVCTLASADQDEVKLPDIGSSANALLSPEQETQLGQQLYRELRSQDAVLDDPELEEYLENLGYRLVAQSEKPEQGFQFFVVRSSEINAFAVPGGFIGVNAGLIATADKEDELAAVMAHEVAHVTQKHVLRAYEKMTKVSLPIALAMLGALVAAKGGGGDAAQAAIVGGTALMQQSSINFTRHNEYEADRVGIHTLARAGFDPSAMASFFGRMGRALRANGEGPPEFLRTHPVTTTRVSEAKNRAEALTPAERAPIEVPLDAGDDPLASPTLPAIGKRPSDRIDAPTAKTTTGRGPDDRLGFLLFRERARVFGAEEPRTLLSYYQGLLDNAPDEAYLRYGMGLALIRANRARDAIAWLAPLERAEPHRPTYALAMADAQFHAGKPNEALTRLERLLAERPDNRAVILAYTTQLLASTRPRTADRAIGLLRPLLTRTNGEDPAVQLAFARACEIAGDEVRAGEAHAEVALLNGRFEDALQQLGNLLKRADVDYYQRARIEARIAQITPVALEQRRKRRTSSDDA